MPKVTFSNKNHLFFSSLKFEVEQYFNVHKLNKTGNFTLYAKALILIPMALCIYVALLTVHLPAWQQMVGCAMLGVVLSGIGFNVMHDACHNSYSSKKWVNNLLGLTLNGLGGNAFFWKQKHNILHHTYTNITGMDDDIAQSKLVRQSPAQKWMRIHAYQHIYLPVAYALTIFIWAGVRDFDKYFKKRIYTTPLQKMSINQHFIFWISKILYVVFYIVIPILLVGWKAWLIGYLIMGCVMSIIIAAVFQLAHAVEGPEFDAVENELHIETEWAVHQVKTTANFSPKNKWLSWFVGGLNYQIEHHLFPRISHIHYPALSNIVQKQCKEYNIPYHSFNSMREAISSHFRIMKSLGKKPDSQQ